MHKIFNFNISTFILTLFFFLIYLFLPTQNSSIDAYNYAANVKWNHDLFFPHHLLYNFLPDFFIKLLGIFHFQPDLLAFMKMMNAVFAALSLFILFKILDNSQDQKKNILPMVLIAGSCFGFMRYATENETYIVPIFWSLWSSYFFLKYIKSNIHTDILYSGIFATIACLFHQIHILWYTGLLLGTFFYLKDIKKALWLAAPGIIIPIIYYLAYKQVHFEYDKAQNLWQFVFYDYYFGTARVQFGVDNLILGFISFIRSFIQVHGMMPVLIKLNYLYALAFAPLLFTVFYTIKYLWVHKLEKSKPTTFIKTTIIIFLLHFAFAVFSEGNAEFMVMLPLLLLLLINGLYRIKNTIYLSIGISLFIWNLTFGLIPNYFYDFQNQEKIVEIMDKKKNAIFVLSENALVENLIYYRKGISSNPRIYKSPSMLIQQNKSTIDLKNCMDSCLLNQIEIFTDCIDEPKVMSRKQYFVNNENELFFNQYSYEKIDSIETIIGTKYISLIKNSISIQ